MVFSDLTGSTALGERLDPESLSRVMAHYYEAMRAVVLHHGGTVEGFAGDAIMAVFGVPAAHEDDALRAVRAAAGMHAALAELSQRLEREAGVRLELHTGVNTGEVIAGNPDLSTSLIVGDAVNLAARLEQAAGPGEILLGRGSWRLVRDAVEVEPPRVLAIPGRRDGEPAYRLLAVRPGAAGRARRHDAPFVGRASELRLFQWAYERAAAEGALHFLTVLGGAGVGKTRLVVEAAGRLPDEPVVLLGRCLPYGNGSTFWPLAEMVRQAAGIGLEDPPAAARAKLAALLDRGAPDGSLVAERIGQLIGLEADPAPIEEVAWSTRRLLETLAAERPLVAILDDLHWAVPTFLDLVEQLTEGTSGAPVLLVAVARPELLEQRPAWAGGRPNAVSVLLEPLGPDDSGALLEGLAGGDPLPAPARERITRAAGGNLLFIEELLAALVEEGRLRRQDGAWVVAGDLATAGTPATIQALIAARLDRLDARDRDVLERAAVVGQAFELETVAELSMPQARAEVPDRLRGLVRREFLRTAPARLGVEAGYQFRHLLVRDAVYQAVPKGVRAEPHERLAGLLEERAGARVREYEEIVGYHLEQAWRCLAELGPVDRRGRELGARAAGRLAAAGRRALARGDTPAATALLDRALALLPTDDPLRGHLLNELAESLVAAGEFGRADEALTAAAVAAEAGGDGQGLLAQVAVGRLGMRLLTEPELPSTPSRARSAGPSRPSTRPATIAAWPGRGACSATRASCAAASSGPRRRWPGPSSTPGGPGTSASTPMPGACWPRPPSGARCRSPTASSAAAGCWTRPAATAMWRAASCTSSAPWRPCRAASSRPATWSTRAPRSPRPWASCAWPPSGASSRPPWSRWPAGPRRPRSGCGAATAPWSGWGRPGPAPTWPPTWPTRWSSGAATRKPGASPT